jgi:hypothetical protein
MKQRLTFTFKTVATQEAADDMIVALAKENIPAEVRKDEFNLVPAYGGAAVNSNYEVLIRLEDKAKAGEIITELTTEFLKTIDPEHYLFSYSDNELLNVLGHKYEWNEIDLLLSEKILTDRGVEINQTAIKRANNQRFEELATPKKGMDIWIVLGYIFALLGGLLGLMIAYSVIKVKRNLPDGSTIYEYDHSTRRHAKIIFALSLIVISSLLTLQLSNGAI